MAQHAYATITPRVGKIRGEILRHAVPREVLGITGNNHKMPENKSDTMIFRRYIPFGGASTNSTTQNDWTVDPTLHETQEGVAPTPDTVNAVDITTTLRQYSCLYMYTDKVARLYEDDIPAAMKKQTGQRMALLREMIKYGALKGCTNKFFSGGTSRATVSQVISETFLSKIARSLLANRADLVTEVLSASANFNTAPIEAAFLVFCHTDCEHDIRLLPDFKTTAEYGSRKTMHAMELGSKGRFRFIVSPELDPIADSGAAVAGLGLKSTTGTNADVYPVIVVAEEAWGDVALRGADSFEETDLPPDRKDKSDPQGQRGYVGAKFWSTAFVQNDGWMAAGEVAVTDL